MAKVAKELRVLKKVRKSNRELKQPSQFDVEIPTGYKVIESGDFAPIHNFSKKGETLEGKVISIKKSTFKKYKNSRAMTLKLFDGRRVAVWSCKDLDGLYDEAQNMLTAKEEPEVFMTFLGLGKKKGKNNPMKLFVSGIKE